MEYEILQSHIFIANAMNDKPVFGVAFLCAQIALAKKLAL